MVGANGYIKLYRKLLDNPVVCKDPDHLAVWIYLLLNATHKQKKMMFEGKSITLNPGQLITGRKSISSQIKVSESKVQRVLKLLESEQQIEQQTTPRNRLITVLSWTDYQTSEQQVNNGFDGVRQGELEKNAKNEQQNEQQNSVNNEVVSGISSYGDLGIEQQLNNNRTTTEQQLNTNKNDKNDKNDKKDIYGEFRNVCLTAEEYQKLSTRLNGFEKRIEDLSTYIESTGKKYKSHYATILAWARKDGVFLTEPKEEEEPQKQFESEEQRQAQVDFVSNLLSGKKKSVDLEDLWNTVL